MARNDNRVLGDGIERLSTETDEAVDIWILWFNNRGTEYAD
ncbi:hypothetical protein N9L74_04980 [Luminiphilus sp.]|nr:hypothetical protein [Luminiphilus sp.]